MAEPALLAGEKVVMSSLNDELVLTNFRVKYESQSGGGSAYKSIPLHKVSACALTTQTHPIYLIIAGLCFLGAVAISNSTLRSGFALSVITLVIIYFFSRSGQIEVFSDAGHSIPVPTKGLKHEEVRRFTEAIALEITKLR